MLSTLRSRRFGAFVLIVVVVAVVGEVAVALVNSRGVPGTTQVAGTVYLADGQRPSVELPAATTLDGGQFDPASVHGQVTVINFWASWCPPCLREAPVLEAMSKDLAPAGVTFLGVDSQESAPEPGRLFVRDVGVSYRNIFDADGRVQLAFSRSVQLRSLPVTIVLDAQGKVGGVVYGEVHYSELNALIKRVLGQ